MEPYLYFHRYPFWLVRWAVWELDERYELLPIAKGWTFGRRRARARARYALDQFEATRYY